MRKNKFDFADVIFRGSQFKVRLDHGRIPRPYYAYGMYQAALIAQRLGLSKISAIEFGVAGGNGLLAMENIAHEIEIELPVEFDIYGFDTGAGLPDPIDYRDLPYLFRKGDYEMDETKLRSRLSRSHLVLGNVADTMPSFCSTYNPAPVGFVSIDLDFYSSTVNALTLFDMDAEYLLPRVYCYFDDVIGIASEFEIHNEWVGELLAIKEFNKKHAMRKIAPIYGLCHKRHREISWSETVVAVRTGIEMTIPSDCRLIFVGEEQRSIQSLGHRQALPFLERNGNYWGPPQDSSTAISELKRMRQDGAEFIVFAWPALWWLDHYSDFSKYLYSSFTCIFATDTLVVFDLRQPHWSSRAVNRILRLFPWSPVRIKEIRERYYAIRNILNVERDEYWNDMIFVLHAFDHELYNKYIEPLENNQRPLE